MKQAVTVLVVLAFTLLSLGSGSSWAAENKRVDINGAKKEELMKLPGIGDAEADKIIAGRPYGSKVWLVSRGILPEGIYAGISKAIDAKQPYKDGAKNAALYAPKK